MAKGKEKGERYELRPRHVGPCMRDNIVDYDLAAAAGVRIGKKFETTCLEKGATGNITKRHQRDVIACSPECLEIMRTNLDAAIERRRLAGLDVVESGDG